MRTRWWRHNASVVAFTFAVFGLFAFGGGIVFVDMRPVLFVLFWTFLFAAALFRFLTPERQVRADIAERTWEALMRNETTLLETYNTCDAHVYIPAEGAGSEGVPVRLFVPRAPDSGAEPTGLAELESSFVVSDAEGYRGLSLLPSGGYLFREFESLLGDELSDAPEDLAVQLADGLTEGLELANRVVPSVEAAERRATFRIDDSAYGPVDRFDHPVSSFLAVGLAVGLARSIVAETTAEGNSSYVVTCRWEDSEGVDRRGSEREANRTTAPRRASGDRLP